MIKIRSTEKLATSATKGLCDVARQMLSYNEDLVTDQITIVIKDELFQEQNASKTIESYDDDGNIVESQVDIVERLIIESKQPKAFHYNKKFIDGVFSALGTTISKTKSYTDQQNVNKLSILIAQTVSASNTGWYGMINWMPDTEHELVNTFSEE